MKNQVYVTDNGQKIYNDRSVGVSLFIFTADKSGKWYVLCNQRGNRTSDSKLMWNVPSGYLDWGEDGTKAAVRETKEECGLDIPWPWVTEAEHSTSPEEHKQHIIFRYYAIVPSYYLDKKLISTSDEEDEVRNIKWIPLRDLKDYNFAFNQDETIGRIFTDCVLLERYGIVLEKLYGPISTVL